MKKPCRGQLKFRDKLKMSSAHLELELEVTCDESLSRFTTATHQPPSKSYPPTNSNDVTSLFFPHAHGRWPCDRGRYSCRGHARGVAFLRVVSYTLPLPAPFNFAVDIGRQPLKHKARAWGNRIITHTQVQTQVP